MHGVGRARGAVTIVNALPLGQGAAVGVELVVTAAIDLETVAEGSERFVADPPTSATPVVRAAVRAALARFVPSAPVSVAVRLDSEIPPAKGLKSSSAVASAVALAVANAAGASSSPVEIARLSAEAGRRSGASATGAFDDAVAGLTSGVVVTDNGTDRLLAKFDVPADLEAVVLLPAGTHAAAPDLLGVFQRRREEARSAVDLAMRGSWAEAMERNSALVESALGYSYAELRGACRREGAAASGVSGLGPAFAALAAGRAAGKVERLLSDRDGRVLRVPVGRSLAVEGGP